MFIALLEPVQLLDFEIRMIRVRTPLDTAGRGCRSIDVNDVVIAVNFVDLLLLGCLDGA